MSASDFVSHGIHKGFILERSISPPYPKGWKIEYYYVGTDTEVGAQYVGENAQHDTFTRQSHTRAWLPTNVRIALDEFHAQHQERPKLRPKLQTPSRPKLERKEDAVQSSTSRPTLNTRPRLLRKT